MLTVRRDAEQRLDVSVLYGATVRPFDGAALRAVVAEQRGPSVVIVEPYLAGTSVAEIGRTLQDLPHRVLGLGVGLEELRRYGTSRQHAIAHGLGSAGLRLSITSFLGT